MKRIVKKLCSVLAVGVAAWSVSSPTQAADPADQFPDRRIEVVVPVTPGSATDILARLLAEKLSTRLGQPVTVNNKPGASSKIGADYVKKAPADGYTLLVVHSGILAGPLVYKAFDLDFRQDFSYISAISWTPWVLAINTDLQVQTFQDLVAYAKARPGKLNIGTTGGSGELDIRMLMQQSGMSGELVVYPGGTQVMTALAANEVQVALNAIRGVDSLKGRGVIPIAVTSAQRFGLAPDLPTIAESGVPGFNGGSLWFGLLGPADMPQPVIDKLNREVQEILKMPDITSRLTTMAHEVISSNPEDFRKFVLTEIDKYERTARDAKFVPR